MNIKKMKSNNAISMVDIIIAVVVLSLFVGVIGSLYYQIAFNSSLIKNNAVATYYAIKIAEDIDIMPYEEVSTTINENLKTKYEIPDNFNVTVEVKNYNEEDTTKEDILKIVTINIEYTCLKQNQKYKLEKVKVKEL